MNMRLATAALVLAVLLALLPAMAALPAGAQAPITISRVSGPSRDATSVAISQTDFPNPTSAQIVVLASNTDYTDALAGTPLAVADHGPLLLTGHDTLDPVVAAEIARVLGKGGQLDVLGGGAALPDAIVAQVEKLGYAVTRVSGPDRFSTAVAVAGALGNPSTVLEATGTDFPDALSAGAAAAKVAGAVLLTNGSIQHSATAAYLTAHPGTHYATGGPACTADAQATCVAGTDRFATAVAVAERFFDSPATAGFASGLAFPDALAGGTLAGESKAPILLVHSSGALPASLVSYLATTPSIVTGSLFGGSAAVGEDVLAALTGNAGSAGSAGGPPSAGTVAAPVLAWQQLLPVGSSMGQSSPNVASLAGGPSVVVGSESGTLYAFHLADGSAVPGWPVQTPTNMGASPAVTPMPHGAPGSEVIIGDGTASSPVDTGGILAYGPDGHLLWDRLTPSPPMNGEITHRVSSSVMIGKLGNNGPLVATAGTLGQAIYSVAADNGAVAKGWPYTYTDSAFSSPALAIVPNGSGENAIEGVSATTGTPYNQVHYNQIQGGWVYALQANGTRNCSGAVLIN